MGGIVGSRLHLRHDNLSAFIEENSRSQLVVASKYVKVAWDSAATCQMVVVVVDGGGGR